MRSYPTGEAGSKHVDRQARRAEGLEGGSSSALCFPGSATAAVGSGRAKVLRSGLAASGVKGGPRRPLPRRRGVAAQTAAKVRGFSPIASRFTAETDWLLEGAGFEPSVPRKTPGILAKSALVRAAFSSGGKQVRAEKPSRSARPGSQKTRRWREPD